MTFYILADSIKPNHIFGEDPLDFWVPAPIVVILE